MTVSAAILARIITTDSANAAKRRELEHEGAIADVVGESGKRETVTLSAAFTALSPPTGAVAVAIRWISGTGNITLKGVTGDTGVDLGVLDGDSPVIILPLSSPSIGLLSDASGTVEVLWL